MGAALGKHIGKHIEDDSELTRKKNATMTNVGEHWNTWIEGKTTVKGIPVDEFWKDFILLAFDGKRLRTVCSIKLI